MGYDIYIQTADGKQPLQGDEKYFHFAYTAMPRTLDAMHNFGMLIELPVPDQPKLSDFGLTGKDLQPGTDPSPEVQARIDAFRAAYFAVKDVAQPEPKGIPAYKLRYNDGFLTTVGEITAALATYEAHPHVAMAEMPVGDLTWPRWVAFLRRARAHGGFRTH
ncbi:hypothetical protein ABZ626_03570 [Streptomyces longispororuber]|uniref:hypothetical protein n=1 Tax=Streptomyces longispororuber TaxID=68230 RepID=UPI0033CA3DA6